VPAVKTIVLRRILGNLLRNTLKEASKVATAKNPVHLQLCDGRWDDTVRGDRGPGQLRGIWASFPRGEIDFDSWSKYLNRLEGDKREVRGDGIPRPA